MNDYKKYLDKQLQNPEFAAEWERQRPEREYIKAIVAARLEQNLTYPAVRCPNTPNTSAACEKSHNIVR